MNLYLIGFMGCGKSTWARQLSRELGMPAFDMDNIIEDLEGEDIHDIFYGKGEEYFRKLEQKVLADIARANKGYIIATGGGTPCFFNNIDVMNEKGVSIYLKASKPYLFSVLKNNRNTRPIISMMNNLELKQFIDQALDERERYYNQATTIIDIERTTLPLFMQAISRCINQHI